MTKQEWQKIRGELSFAFTKVLAALDSHGYDLEEGDIELPKLNKETKKNIANGAPF